MDEALKPFFDAILDAPDDDGPRLRLADFLDTQGDKRGESIRLACELERLERDDPARQELAKQIARLPKFTYFHCQASPPWHGGWRAHRRGFIDEVEWSVEQLVAHGDDLVRCTPVRGVRVLRGILHKGEALAACRAMSRIKKLEIPPTPPEGLDDLITVGRSPHLASLRELVLENQALDASLIARLENPGQPAFPALQVLRLIRGAVPPEAIPAILALVDRRGLGLLDLTHAGASEPTKKALRERLGDRLLPREKVLTRDLSRQGVLARCRFGKLSLDGLRLTPAELAAVVERGPYPGVKSLSVGAPVGDTGAEVLARGGAFPDLEELSLDGTGLGDHGARAFAAAVRLDRLASLNLGEALDERGVGVSDETASAIALSPGLPSLRLVERSRTWRYDLINGREGRESVRIERPDGSVVESVTHHWMFP